MTGIWKAGSIVDSPPPGEMNRKVAKDAKFNRGDQTHSGSLLKGLRAEVLVWKHFLARCFATFAPLRS